MITIHLARKEKIQKIIYDQTDDWIYFYHPEMFKNWVIVNLKGLEEFTKAEIYEAIYEDFSEVLDCPKSDEGVHRNGK